MKYWYRLFRRTSDLLNIDLHERIALTMLDLSEDFGIADARGTLLGVPIRITKSWRALSAPPDLVSPST